MTQAWDDSEARILELLLERTPAAEAELERLDDPARVARLRDFFARARERLSPTPPISLGRERALVERILARTTRADAGRAGDVRLFGRFLRDRLASSLSLRLVAAALLLELFAVPVVALLLRHAQPAARRIRFELPRETPEAPFADEVREELGLDLGDPSAGPAREAYENAAARARFVLTTRRGPIIEGLEGAVELPERLLAARARYLAQGTWEPWLDELEVAEVGDVLERVLWLELLLDRWQLARNRAPALDALVASLDAVREREDALGALARAAAERAFARAALPSPPGFEPERIEPPLGAAWFASLGEAFARRGTPAACLAAWFEWQPRPGAPHK